VLLKDFWRQLHPRYKIPAGYWSVWVLRIESLTHYNGPVVITVKVDRGRLMVREEIPGGMTDREQGEVMGWLAAVVALVGGEVGAT
jgi:hypothetical protein